jgi:hypothetical protein
MGATLAWYGRQDRLLDGSVKPAALPGPPSDAVRAMLLGLTHAASARSVPALLASDPARLRAAGMYSWWVDADGASDLSAGLGLTLVPGLVYAGQAGATRWPSGSSSGNTLWSRLAGMHATGNVKSSTFRRTLHAVLTPSPGRPPDEAHLSRWMAAHLRVVTVPWTDADTLAGLELAVLARLDPPLNLAGMRPTPLRDRLKRLRSEGDPDPGPQG